MTSYWDFCTDFFFAIKECLHSFMGFMSIIRAARSEGKIRHTASQIGGWSCSTPVMVYRLRPSLAHPSPRRGDGHGDNNGKFSTVNKREAPCTIGSETSSVTANRKREAGLLH